MVRNLKVVFLTTFFIGCGRISLWRAQSLEKRGQFDKAAMAYESFYEKYPQHQRAAEVLYLAGRVYMDHLGQCQKARPLFERAIRNYPDHKNWVQMSRDALFRCPDYFPLHSGRSWILVDSETGGRNMRQEMECFVDSSTHRTYLQGWFFAGKKRFKDFKKEYHHQDWELKEMESDGKGAPTTILKYPMAVGMKWVSRRGFQEVHFEVTDTRAQVKVRAGVFPDVLKLKEQISGVRSWKYDYYAPGVGRILTTVAGPGFENRNTELLSYQVSP
ncbi:MAG: tetratricopeptide repeat protein [Elusimicrobia bacterium]|nr:tetratricopeptide repeat protein [Elusimicrobiota bacterium]